MGSTLEIPKYKLSSTKAIDKNFVLTFFEDLIVKNILFKEKEAYDLNDGSILTFHKSNSADLIFVELHVNILLFPGEKGMSFPGIPLFIRFCKEIGSKIKTVRNNQIRPASEGAIMSDFYWSSSCKKAQYPANHLKDKK